MTSPPPSPEDPAAARAERKARHLRNLAELGELGMDLARIVQNTAPWRDGDPGLSFERIARAVRQSALLEDAIAEDRLEQYYPKSRGSAGRDIPRPTETDRGKRLGKMIDACITAAGKGGKDAESLRLDAREYLEDPDFLDSRDNRPVSDIIREICEALGIEPDLQACTGDATGMSQPAAPDTTPSPDPPPARDCASDSGPPAECGPPAIDPVPD